MTYAYYRPTGLVVELDGALVRWNVCSLPRADPDLEKPEVCGARVAQPNESVHTGSGTASR